jgi:type II secretory pathway pseudopilin PulG
MRPNDGRILRAFTTIEMLAVLFLAGLLTALTTLSLAAPRRTADLREIVDHVAYADELVRDRARNSHRAGRLAFDLPNGRIADAGESPPRTLYRLAGPWAFDGLIVSGGGNDDIDATTIALSPAGWSRSYALHIAHGGDARWIVVNGVTGQVTECNDERDATDKIGQNGDDAH